MMRLRLVTPPAQRLLTLAQAKAHLRVENDRNNDTINGLILAAECTVDGPEGDLSRALLTQTWALELHHFPRACFDGAPLWDANQWWRGQSERLKEWPDAIFLPLGMASAINAVTYYDEAGVQQTVDTSSYFPVLGDDGMITPVPGVPWPSTQRGRPFAVSIEFDAGYGNEPDALPEAIRRANLLLISHWYENREAVVGVENRDSSTVLPLGVDRLLDRYRLKTRFADS